MTILETIGIILKLIFTIISNWIEKDKARKEEVKKEVENVKTGIKNKDVSSITAGFDNIARIKSS